MENDFLAAPRLVGERLKSLRLDSERTLQEIADRVGLSKSFLSMAESGSRALKFWDLRRVLACYGYSVGWFASEAAREATNEAFEALGKIASAQPVVNPPRDALRLDGSREPGAYGILLMRPMRSPRDVELLRVTLPPRSQTTEQEIALGGEARGIALSGALLVTLNGDEHVVREGDEFYFDGSIPHLIRNYTAQTSVCSLSYAPAAL